MKHERIEVTTTDGSAWLERLSPRQMITIGDCLWSEKRKRILQDMKDAEIDSETRMKAMREHENRRGLMSEIAQHAISMDGALKIIEEASKSKNSENADGLPDNFLGTSEDSIKIALDLLGVTIDNSSDSKSKKK